MQQEIEQLKKQVEELTNKVNELSTGQKLNDLSFDFKEIIRNEVIKDSNGQATLTRDIVVTAPAYSLTLPVNPSGALVLHFRGKDYFVPYVQNI